MNKKRLINSILINIIVLNLIFITVHSIRGKEEASKEFKETLICEDESVWTDSQWQFYNVSVDTGDTVFVTLNYEGDLDLDLRFYWKRDNPVGFNGFDLSHCDIDNDRYVYAENSQIRTTDTNKLGEAEELTISNPTFKLKRDKIAYILVYVYEGEGASDYVLTANRELSKINHNIVYDCNLQLAILIIYMIGAVIIMTLFSLYIKRKKAKITGVDKKKKAEMEKEEEGVKHVDLDTIVK